MGGGGEGSLLPFNVNLVRPALASDLIVLACSVTLILALTNLVLHACERSLRQQTGGTIFYTILSELLFIACFLCSALLFDDFK